MAVEFVTTIGTTDYSFDWIAEEITIESGVLEVSAADLKSAIHDAQDGTQGMYRRPIMTTGNPVTLTASAETFLNVILLDGWKINSFSVSGTLTVGDGNTVSLADGIDIFAANPLVNFVNNTSAAGVYVSETGGGLTQVDLDNISDAVWSMAVATWKATTVGGWLSSKLLTVSKFLSLK